MFQSFLILGFEEDNQVLELNLFLSLQMFELSSERLYSSES